MPVLRSHKSACCLYRYLRLCRRYRIWYHNVQVRSSTSSDRIRVYIFILYHFTLIARRRACRPDIHQASTKARTVTKWACASLWAAVPSCRLHIHSFGLSFLFMISLRWALWRSTSYLVATRNDAGCLRYLPCPLPASASTDSTIRVETVIDQNKALQ